MPPTDKADAQLVGEGAGEETHDGEGRVQGRVCVVVGGCVQLATATHSVDGVEHARAHEAHKGHDEQLHGRRRIPGKPAEYFLVFPRVRQLEHAVGLCDRGLWGGDLVRGLFRIHVGHGVARQDGAQMGGGAQVGGGAREGREALCCYTRGGRSARVCAQK
jgi:hypothetical protein